MTAVPTGDVESLGFADVTPPARAAEPTKALTAGALAIFSGPSLPISALGLPLSVYLPEFYANVIGVKLSVVALIFLIVRLVDLSIDPMLGGMMDRTRSRFGQFKPWLVLGAPLVMAAAYMTFMARPGSGAVYLGLWLFVLYLAYSILSLSHSAWASTLASGYHQRSRVYGWIQGGLVLSMVLVPAIAALAAAARPGESGAGVQAIGWFIIVLAPLTIALTCWRTPEVAPRARSEHAPTPWDYVRLAIRPAVARILLADICLYFSSAVTAALFFFFFRESRGFTTTQANLILVMYFIAGFAGAPLWTKLAKTLGKHRTLIIAALYYAAWQLSFLLVPRGAFAACALVVAFSGLAYSAPTIFIRAMMADAADEADLDQGRISTGMLYAMISSTAKISSALAIFITFAALGAIGFAPKAHAANSPAAIQGLTTLFIALPTLAAVLGAAILRGYGIDERRHAQIRHALDVRNLDVRNKEGARTGSAVAPQI